MTRNFNRLTPKYRPQVCIICQNPSATLSEEHIFPDAVGGRIAYYILCAKCNSDLGRRVDAPFLKQKNIEMARSAHRAAGKSGKIPQPFSEAYEFESSNGPLKFKLNSDFTARIVQSAPSISVTEQGEIHLRISADAADRTDIPKVIRTSLSRFFQSAEGRALGWSQEEQQGAIRRSIDGAATVHAVPEKIDSPISGSWCLDLSALFAEQIKVIYEIACLEFGPTFVESEAGIRMREFLRRKCSEAATEDGWLETASLLGVIPLLNEEIKAFIDSMAHGEASSANIALVTPGGIACSVAGLGATFPFDGANCGFGIEDSRGYVSYIDGSFGGILPFNELRRLPRFREYPQQS